MESRRLAALLAALLVVAAGVGLVDPFEPRPEREPVALDGGPAAAVQDALRQAATGDYTLRITVGAPEEAGGTLTVARVENSEREVLIRSVDSGPTYLSYANPHASWEGRPGHLERGAGERDDRYTPFRRVDALSDPAGNVTVERVAATESTVIYRIGGPLAFRLGGWEPVAGERATMTVVVDRETRTLSRARFVRTPLNESGGERHVTAYDFSAWGETEVRRPSSAGYSLAEFLRDVAS